MTYIVNEKCVKCKLTDCVEVCPVDCFYEGENTLVIHPDECIDCGVCEPECPIGAINPDNDYKQTGSIDFLEFNRKYSLEWPNITETKGPMPGSDDWRDKTDKEHLISTHPFKE